ncbi:MAG: XdhC family protein [Solirubrobacterales bacterium]
MDNREIFHKAVSVLESEGSAALVTVTATVGSTPGKPGYRMLVFSGGHKIAGTVGGGAVEAGMIDEAASMLGQPNTRIRRFNLGESPDDEKGICGGSIEFLIESFDRSALPLFRELISETGSRVLVSIIAAGAPPRKMLIAPDGGREFEGLADGSPEILKTVAEIVAAGCGQAKASAAGVDVFVESMARPPAVVILGAGHVASFISRYASGVHFRVAVCDDRSEYASRERFPDAENIVVEEFDRVFDRLPVDEDSYLVIVTRGHQCDKVVLERALKTPARYIGMIGSKRKTLAILESLREEGCSQESLDRVYSPIGLSIGAVTAEEIALSIVAELVKIRRMGHGPRTGHMASSRGGEP